jgi:heterodisulfide reductase subunit B
MKQNDNFTLSLPNGKKLKFKTKEAFSRVNEIIAKGKYTSVYDMYLDVKKCATGFEYTSKVEQSAKEVMKRFNGIELGD